MNGLLGDGKGAANPLKQLGNREGIDRSLFRVSWHLSGVGRGTDELQDRHVGQASSSSRYTGQQGRTHPVTGGQAQHTPQPFNLSHLSSALSQPDFSADWARVSNRPPSAFVSDYQNQQWAKPAPRSDWAQTYDPKGKGRMISSPQTQMQESPQQSTMSMSPTYHRPFQPSMMGQSGFAPMYQGHLEHQQAQAQAQGTGAHRQMDPREQEKMEAAFERALADAREQSATVQATENKRDEGPAEETKDFKGDLEAVWESLRPEAERLNKLAEWERDFSQVSPLPKPQVRMIDLRLTRITQFTNDEDDLFETLNESLHRDDVGQHSLDEQFQGMWDPEQGVAEDRSDIAREFNEWKSRAMPENGLPETTRYEFGTFPSPRALVFAA